MRSYNEFLQLCESQRQHSIYSSMFRRPSHPILILSPTMLKRRNYSFQDVTAFHTTSPEFTNAILKLQNKKASQISVFLSANSDDVLKGVETEGGIVMEVNGSLDSYFSFDAFTMIAKGGRRYLEVGPETDFGSQVIYYNKLNYGNEISNDVRKRIQNLQKDLIELRDSVFFRNIIPIVKKVYPSLNVTRNDDLELMIRKIKKEESGLRQIRSLTTIEIDETVNGLIRSLNGFGSAASKLIKEYMDGSEKILEKDEYKRLLIQPVRGETGGSTYDEGVMSNFKIKKMHFYRSPYVDERDDEEYIYSSVKDDIEKFIEVKKLKIDYEYWPYTADLISYINSKSTDFKELVNKKLS